MKSMTLTEDEVDLLAVVREKNAELAQKDATIKALAEALDQCRMRAEELPPGLAAVVFSALRLAGALK
jgi:hypothetical protein